jgi:diaminohydroxyphosphoribosylaminopyrimidine deaminase / 5-amino-6-(5-phosphoribosylamino)uracil reductase
MLLHFSVTFAACKMDPHEIYMHRCLQLAKLGEGHVAPNPMVGSVLVHNERIIGEGYHRQYGQPHAEVNCVNSVAEEDQHLIAEAVLYVSLEPCAHYGKTPPCADMIIALGIKEVAIGCRDPFPEVDGKGIEKLKAAGVKVVVGILEEACKAINKRFFTFHLLKRPFILLKWAETVNRKIGQSGDRLMISSEVTNRFVHRLRAQHHAILVGTSTALMDNPRLDARLSTGQAPIRMIIDLHDKLPRDLNIFNNQQRTIVFNYLHSFTEEKTEWYKLNKLDNVINEIVQACYEMQIQSILVEGGRTTLQSFIDAALWDEAIVIQNKQLHSSEGTDAPSLSNAKLTSSEVISTDAVTYFIHQPESTVADQ